MKISYSQRKQLRRILPDDEDRRTLSDMDFTSLAIFLISFLSLTSPHCWHINPLQSASPHRKRQIGKFAQLIYHFL